MFLFWLRQFKDRLDDPKVLEKELIIKRYEDLELRNHPIASFGLSYRPRYWFFDVVSLARRLTLTSFVLVFDDPANMLIFVLFVSVLALVVEREASPYVKLQTSMSVYILQWQVVLFIQFMLLIDANLTSSVGASALGIILLSLNVLLILVIAYGARETAVRGKKRESITVDLGDIFPSSGDADMDADVEEIVANTANGEIRATFETHSVFSNPMYANKSAKQGKRSRSISKARSVEHDGIEMQAMPEPSIDDPEVHAVYQGDDSFQDTNPMVEQQQWQRLHTETGHAYWYNHTTGTSQWEAPELEASAVDGVHAAYGAHDTQRHVYTFSKEELDTI